MFAVGQLRAALAKMPVNMRVGLMIDAEGNGYRWVTEIAVDGRLCKDHDWQPQLVLRRWMKHTSDEEQAKVSDATEIVVVMLTDATALFPAPAVTVGDVRTTLAGLPSDMRVALMTRDHGYMTWATGVDTDALVVEDDVRTPVLNYAGATAEDMGMDVEEWDAVKQEAERVVFLVPVN